MAKNSENDEDDEELSELSFDEDEDDDASELSEDFDDFDEFDDELFKEIEAENLLDAELEKKEALSQAAPEPEKPISKEEDKAVAAEPEVKGPLNLDQLPVSVVVELGNIPMTMDKLLNIEQGNFLDFQVDPSHGVDLTINGKLVAKGELVRIGENLGVRILELG